MATYQDIQVDLKIEDINAVYEAVEYLEQQELLEIFPLQEDKECWDLQLTSTGSSYFYGKKISVEEARKKFIRESIIALIGALIGATISLLLKHFN